MKTSHITIDLIMNNMVNSALGMRNTTVRFASILCLLLVGVWNAWGGSYSLSGTQFGSSNVSNYANGPATLTGSNSSSWTVAGYGVDATNHILTIGKGGANYLQTPNCPENITSIVVTWKGNTSYYLALQTTSGTELEAKSNPSTATEATFTVSGSYKQLKLVGRRSSGTSNAAAQITSVTVNYGSSCTPLSMSEVTATAGNAQIVLTWPAVANANSYTVTCKNKSTGVAAGTVGGVSGSGTKTCTITGLSNGTEYTWSVMPVGTGSYCADNTPATGDATPNVYYTVTWMNNGSSYTTTSVASGQKPTFPDNPSSCDGTSTTFIGWTATPWSGKLDDVSAKTIYTSGSAMPNVSGPVTYHAVFAKATGSGTTTQAATLNTTAPIISGTGWATSTSKTYSGPYLRLDEDEQYVSFTSPKGAISRFQFTYKLNSSTSCTGHNKVAWWIGDVKFYVSTDGGSSWSELSTKSINDINTGTGLGSDVAKDYTDLAAGGYNAIKVQLSKTCGNLGIKGLSATYSNATFSEYLTTCTTCLSDPTINDPTINSSFKLTSLSSTGSAVGVSSSGDPGTDCEWEDYGIVWGGTNPPTVSHNKAVIATSGTSSSFETQIMPSGSTNPNAWVVGTTYYVRTYGKNGKAGAEYIYSTNTVSFTLRSITFNSNGGSSIGPWYVNSGGTYEAPSAPTKDGYVFGGWYTDNGTFENAVDWSAAVTENKTYYAKWLTYGDYVFSCAELTLEPHLVTTGTPIFITSAAGKKVRSQDSIHIEGSGLTPSTTLTFPGLPSTFEIKTATYGDLATDGDGAIDAAAYIFYTPAADATSDGLDKITGITVTVGGAKTKTVSLTQDIIGRHLPADFVIAGKKDGKWYALPDTMTMTTHPTPIEIAVDDANNPSVAYTAATNIYNLYGQNSGAGYLEEAGQYVKLGMKNNSTFANYPLLGTALTAIGKSTGTDPTHNLDKQYWWLFTQTNTSITNPQDAKYIVHCANNSSSLSIKNDPFQWGLYASGVEELRLIPASSIIPTEAYFVEWAQHGGVVEVDAQGVNATSVVAHLNGVTSSAVTLVQTKAGDAKNKTSKYNYTVNFGDGIDFAAAASNGAMLTLEWKNGETVKAVSNIVVPKIVASNITINKTNYPLKSDWNTEVHVLPGKTVTVDPSAYDGSNVTIKNLEIYPGATVVASTGTLIATNLVLRNGWSRAGEKTYDVARLFVTESTATLKATNVYADWYIDYDQYYPVAVPWNATVANFTYRYCSVTPSVGPEANIRLRYYDGNSRATNVQEGVGSGANWKAYGEGSNLAVPTTLTPSSGYVMTAKRPTGKAFSIIRMPLTLPSGTWGDGSWTTNGESGNISTTHKDQIAVTAWGVKEGSNTAYAEGWNLIANPYMSIYRGTISLTPTEGDATTVNFVNIPDIDFKEYDQRSTATATLKPASAFLIQASKTGTITFGTASRKASAPSYRREETESVPEQQAYILLNGNDAEDEMGILVSDKYTAEYELNADLEKLLSDGTSLRTYMQYCDRNMAYLAINEELAKQLIPVSVRIPADGEYTFRIHEASIANELEGIYLTDYQANTVTNLLYDSYTFNAVAGTDNARFAINAVIGKREVPTGVDISGSDKDKPTKFIWNDKVYILHNNVIYDSTGKRVNVINK